MKERPIIFSTPMIKAIMDGRKTMTRRIVKEPYQSYPCVTKHITSNEFDFHYDQGVGQFTASPYGKPGDVLWVRETFYAYGHWTLITTTLPNSIKKEYHFHNLIPEYKIYMYEDSPPEVILKRWGLGYHKRPLIFMPKEASRIRLKITDIKVERVQDITDEDALMEGVLPDQNIFTPGELKEAYSALWESINGKYSWEMNQWVWCLTFERI